LNMVGTAGKLDNWAKAIKAAREGLPKTTPLKASIYWRMMYKAAREKWEYKEKLVEKKFKHFSQNQLSTYKELSKGTKRRSYVQQLKAKNRTQQLAALYWKIIRARVGTLAEGEAPWWYILNYGIARLKSDRRGIAYPVAIPTRFVEKTEMELTRIFKDMLKGSETKKDDTIIETEALKTDTGKALRGETPVRETYIRYKTVHRSRASGRFASADDEDIYSQNVILSNQYLRNNY